MSGKHRHHKRGEQDQPESSLQRRERQHAADTATNMIMYSTQPTIPCSTSTEMNELCATWLAGPRIGVIAVLK